MTEQTSGQGGGIRPELVINCPHARCAAPVFEVQLGPGLVRTLLDAEPVTWVDNGRIRILDAVPVVKGDPPFARRLAHAGLAFGQRRLFRPHAETCKVAQKRTRTKATSS